MGQVFTRMASLLVLAIAGQGAQAQGSPAAKPVRVGFICPFTGGSQDFGNSARIGAELALKEINEVGGYLGRPIELVARDDKANPDEGRRISEELVLKEKVDFTVGFCNTGVALKSLDVFQDHKHLLMVPVSTGSMVTQLLPSRISINSPLAANNDSTESDCILADHHSHATQFQNLLAFAIDTNVHYSG